MSLKWEEIEEKTYRTKVPGGWLVKLKGYSAWTITYVPDPNYQWTV